MTALLAANLAPACFLAGIAWYLQVVQLPLLRDSGGFAPWIRAHRLRNTALMSVPMIVESAASVGLCLRLRDWAGGVLLAAVIAILAATFVGIVPAFRRLARGWDPRAVDRLRKWNGARTLLWTARSGALLYLLLNRG